MDAKKDFTRFKAPEVLYLSASLQFMMQQKSGILLIAMRLVMQCRDSDFPMFPRTGSEK